MLKQKCRTPHQFPSLNIYKLSRMATCVTSHVSIIVFVLISIIVVDRTDKTPSPEDGFNADKRPCFVRTRCAIVQFDVVRLAQSAITFAQSVAMYMYALHNVQKTFFHRLYSHRCVPNYSAQKLSLSWKTVKTGNLIGSSAEYHWPQHTHLQHSALLRLFLVIIMRNNSKKREQPNFAVLVQWRMDEFVMKVSRSGSGMRRSHTEKLKVWPKFSNCPKW